MGKDEKKNTWLEISGEEKEEIFTFAGEYADFLTASKTEREFVEAALELMSDNGFREINSVKKLEPGARIYSVNRGGQLIAAVIGKKKPAAGLRILGTHIDSPRLDLKPNPLYEEGELALLSSHYYGGIKKYQWVTIPLALHGVIIKEDGRKIRINIGEREEDPVFYISDLLPHLGEDQMKKKMSEAISGEQLNIIIGSIPVADEEEDNKIKRGILKLLEEKYDIDREDFVSADLQAVPAFNCKDIGFDRGLLGGYGHDDRVCSYAALKAIMSVENPEYTALTLLVDKEEIGSMGATGMQSRFFENFVAKMVNLYYEDYSDLLPRETLAHSEAISGDVAPAFDPDFSEVYARDNSSFIGKGLVLTKYTGGRGKAGSSEATAEFMGKIRGLFNRAGVLWQTGELGKIDKGGGGTIAQFMANYNMDVLDAGPPILSMHSPYEAVSKIDLYNTYLGYTVFLENE